MLLFHLTLSADWLIQIFDYWFYRHTNTRIRIFDSIIRLLCGYSSLVEAIGLDPVALIVIETNGSIDAVDTLKTTFEGATRLEYDVFKDDFDTVAKDVAVRSRQLGANALCQKCKDCPVVNICGGGYLPHRYSSKKGFDNPSIYCSDIKKLIHHIHEAVAGELNKQTLETVVV